MQEPETKNRAFLGAWRKGYQARKIGKPRRPPYSDHRTGKYDHIVTFSRAFIKYWREGWDAADEELDECAYCKDSHCYFWDPPVLPLIECTDGQKKACKYLTAFKRKEIKDVRKQ